MTDYAPNVSMPDAQRMMMYDANKKSNGVAYLLWLFFGSLGAHRFYAGRTRTAITMLVITVLSFPLMLVLIGFFSISAVGIWVLVDAFLIPSWIREHNNRLASGLDR